MEQNSAPGRQEASLVGSGGIQNGGGFEDQSFTFAAGAAVAGAGGVAIGGAGGVSVGGGISVAGDAGAVGGGGGAVGPSSQSSIGKKRGNHRHSEQQINAMDAYYKDNRYPNKSQRNELAWRARINPDQVQFWFQNQRTQEKRKSKREENEALRSELDVLTAQNPQYEEAIQLLDKRNRLKFESIHIREATELRKSTLARFIAGENLQNLPIFQDPQNPTTSQNPQNLSSTFHNSQNLPMTIQNPQKLPNNIPKSRNNTSAEFTKRPCNITYPQALPIISQNEQNFPIISEADDVNPYPADTGLAYTSTIITTSGEGINLISAVPTSEEYWGDI